MYKETFTFLRCFFRGKVEHRRGVCRPVVERARRRIDIRRKPVARHACVLVDVPEHVAPRFDPLLHLLEEVLASCPIPVRLAEVPAAEGGTVRH